ncbi:thiaminase II [Meridianimarinicoccus roseus]|uniref:Thiaminase II n=1 Tax=Meridianimarinicoccus roseus TaxID=2072018 RepID=A0A2V2L636_9RHOB|nr:TenA family protein [Meridianimarinicoccus roseus]PWR00858.1 thiaminase II [Meridianimarinicoccus roseus]
MTDSYGATFPLWRASCPKDWAAYTGHPFVTGLGDGSLPRAAFLRYMRQDYLFLVHFARAWALAVTKADSIDDMRACAATVHALIDDEMRLHIATCAALGLTEADLAATREAPATLAYTRYVLDAGHAGDMADLLAALAPCVLGYGEIGARLAASGAAPAYADWVATYGGTDYQRTCAEVGALIDRVIAARLGPDPAVSPRWPALCARFAAATRLEADFWQMGWDAR